MQAKGLSAEILVLKACQGDDVCAVEFLLSRGVGSPGAALVFASGLSAPATLDMLLRRYRDHIPERSLNAALSCARGEGCAEAVVLLESFQEDRCHGSQWLDNFLKPFAEACTEALDAELARGSRTLDPVPQSPSCAAARIASSPTLK